MGRSLGVGMLVVVLGVAGCAGSGQDDDSDTTLVTPDEDPSDYTYDLASAVTITLGGTSITTSDSSAVKVSGSTATITAEGTYKITGSLTDGQLVVDASKSVVKLVLVNASLASSSTAPLYVVKAARTILILPDGSKSTLSDGKGYCSDAEPNAAVFANSSLAFFGEGSGALTVTGNCGDGVSTDDGLIVKSGVLEVSAVDDAIRGKDYLIVRGGTVRATASTGHALKSDEEENASAGFVTIEGGTLELSSDGGDAIHATNDVKISGGTFAMSASSQGINAARSVTIDGGELVMAGVREGIESKSITINAGSVSIDASDDSLNATAGVGGESADGSSLVVNGGFVRLNSTRGDAVDSNGDVRITGGTLIAHGPSSQPEVGLDFNGQCLIEGGMVVISGPSSRMTQKPDTGSTQPSVLLQFRSTRAAGSLLQVQDSTGSAIATFAPARAYQTLLVSSPALKSGQTYTVVGGGTSSGVNQGGLYSGGTLTGGTVLGTVTISGTSSSATVN